MKLLTCNVLALLLITGLAAQTRRQNVTRSTSQTLNRVTAAKVIELRMQKIAPRTDGFEVGNLDTSISDLREVFSSFRTAEKLGWIELHENGAKTEVVLTPRGRHIFEERPTKDAYRNTSGSYTFIEAHVSLKRITGIRLLRQGEALVEYEWFWQPSDLIKTVVGNSGTTAGTSRIVKYDDGWRVEHLGIGTL